MPCRINRRRQWTARILLEAKGFERMSSFVTLTYSPENVPWEAVDPDWPGAVQQVLRKKDLTLWVKRIRAALAPEKLRYFAVGEYGTLSWRPHFHAILFGVEPPSAKALCEATWEAGYHTVAEMTPERAAYTASYTVKKIMQEAPRGRPPEFSSQSRNPGIGVSGLKSVIAAFQTRKGSAALADGRITKTIRLEGKIYPLDRTMVKHLLEGLALPADFKFWRKEEEEHGTEEVEKARLQDAKLRRKAGKSTSLYSV